MVWLERNQGGITMSKCVVAKNELMSFIGGFGPGVDDLRLTLTGNVLGGGVALSTHFLQKSISVDMKEAGDFIISDIAKVLQFLKATSGTEITLSQNLDGRNTELLIKSGQSTMTFPTNSEVSSQSSLDAAEDLVNKAIKSNWEEFAGNDLDVYGVVNISDVVGVVPLGKVAGEGTSFSVSILGQQNKMVIQTGKNHTGTIYHAVDVADCKIENDENKSSTQFGPWFTDVLSTLPSGTAEIYSGLNAPLIFNHNEKNCLLIVIDQRPDEV